MKYDRPVRELLAECAAALKQPFTKPDVIDWFHANYPDVAASTINTHIAGLTAGNRPHPHLATFPPVMERVGHGLYRRLAAASPVPNNSDSEERTQTSLSDPASASSADVLLIGCVKSKQATSAPARDLYTGALFTRRRAYAEQAARPWFIISGRLGLVAPDEVIAPYELYLAGMSARYRAAWGAFVAAQLAELIEPRGKVIEIHAGDAYVDSLRAPLSALGAVVEDPVDASSLGGTLAWYDGRFTRSDAQTKVEDLRSDETQCSVIPDEAVAALRDEGLALRVAELLASDREWLAKPGMYSWWVDAQGAADLSDGLGQRIEPGLIYAGQAGATRWPSGRRSTNTLWGRLVGMHLGGRARFSTFRLTLAAILQSRNAGAVDEAGLTEWMTAHLRVVPYPIDDGDPIDELESQVLARLDPPLNLAKRPSTPTRQALSRLRQDMQAR